MTTAQSYWNSQWWCNSENIAPLAGYTKPRFLTTTGWHYFVPYNWGGWDTFNQFIGKMVDGQRAGNINTSNVFVNHGGVDCSGYVQRCWGISSHKHDMWRP